MSSTTRFPTQQLKQLKAEVASITATLNALTSSLNTVTSNLNTVTSALTYLSEELHGHRGIDTTSTTCWESTFLKEHLGGPNGFSSKVEDLAIGLLSVLFEVNPSSNTGRRLF